jgi:hypothetical protein
VIAKGYGRERRGPIATGETTLETKYGRDRAKAAGRRARGNPRANDLGSVSDRGIPGCPVRKVIDASADRETKPRKRSSE